ncbi:MAG: beta-lactamase family protein, partial [bacterium]|nr:beta-lactamase family protein [bacterium]
MPSTSLGAFTAEFSPFANEDLVSNLNTIPENPPVDDAAASIYVPFTNTSQPFGQEITLHHLISHTAGYATFWEDQWPYEIPGLFQ